MRGQIFQYIALIVLLAGCAGGGTPTQSNVDDSTIVLGSVLSLTGKYATNGIHAQNGYELAVERVNETGGVRVDGKSYKLKVRYYDDESRPATAAQLIERLIKRDGVQFMLGPYSSGITRAVAPVTEKHKVPMIEAEGAARSLFSRGYRNLFAVLSTSDQYLASAITLAAEIAEKNGKKRSDVTIAMAFENDPFSQDVRAGVIERAKDLGMRIVVDDTLPRNLSNMSTILTRVHAVAPDVLVVSAHTQGAATAARQLKEMNINVPLVAITHCEAARIIDSYGAASTEGILCPTQWAETLHYSDKYFGSAADYDRLFKSTYRGYRAVPYQSAGASAAVLVWKDALERANSFDPERVRDAIAATDMMTFYGRIKFAPEGKNIAKPMVLRQIQNGKYVVVAPTKWAPHELLYPRPTPQ